MSDKKLNPIAGQPINLADGLRLILAPNPSLMTYWGTNTYILGDTSVAIIDPGPDDDDHLTAIIAAVGVNVVSHIFVTHAHIDHSPLSRKLSERTGALVYAYGPAEAGRSEVMQKLANQGLAGGGEGIDTQFAPDKTMATGDIITTDQWTLQALHTPGHIGNHLSLIWRDAVFTGDHIMGWASSLVSPPDGDLTDFMISCEKLDKIDAKIFYPGHGAPVVDPAGRIKWLIAHRKKREAQILNAIRSEGLTTDQITRLIYVDVGSILINAAKRNVFAHLVDLSQKGLIKAFPSLNANAIFRLKN